MRALRVRLLLEYWQGFCGAGGLLAWRWQGIGGRGLLGFCAVAPESRLLGLVFDATPIKLRYFAFATPFVAALLVGLVATLPRRGDNWLVAALLSV